MRVGWGGGAQELDGVLSQTAVGFNGKWDEIRVWVAAAFVLFAALGGIVGGGGGVVSSGCFRYGVSDIDINEIGCGVVVGNNVEFGLFVIWSAGVSVEFGDVDFSLGVVTMLLQPFL